MGQRQLAYNIAVCVGKAPLTGHKNISSVSNYCMEQYFTLIVKKSHTNITN